MCYSALFFNRIMLTRLWQSSISCFNNKFVSNVCLLLMCVASQTKRTFDYNWVGRFSYVAFGKEHANSVNTYDVVHSATKHRQLLVPSMHIVYASYFFFPSEVSRTKFYYDGNKFCSSRALTCDWLEWARLVIGHLEPRCYNL